MRIALIAALVAMPGLAPTTARAVDGERCGQAALAACREAAQSLEPRAEALAAALVECPARRDEALFWLGFQRTLTGGSGAGQGATYDPYAARTARSEATPAEWARRARAGDPGDLLAATDRGDPRIKRSDAMQALLGRTLAGRGQWRRARTAYREALAISPGNSVWRAEYYYTYLWQRAWEEAAAVWPVAEAAHPADAAYQGAIRRGREILRRRGPPEARADIPAPAVVPARGIGTELPREPAVTVGRGRAVSTIDGALAGRPPAEAGVKSRAGLQRTGTVLREESLVAEWTPRKAGVGVSAGAHRLIADGIENWSLVLASAAVRASTPLPPSWPMFAGVEAGYAGLAGEGLATYGVMVGSRFEEPPVAGGDTARQRWWMTLAVQRLPLATVWALPRADLSLPRERVAFGGGFRDHLRVDAEIGRDGKADLWERYRLLAQLPLLDGRRFQMLARAPLAHSRRPRASVYVPAPAATAEAGLGVLVRLKQSACLDGALSHDLGIQDRLDRRRPAGRERGRLMASGLELGCSTARGWRIGLEVQRRVAGEDAASGETGAKSLFQLVISGPGAVR